MNVFHYKNGLLHAEDVPVDDLADRFGTPLYIYSRTHIMDQYRSLMQAMKPLKPLICYSVKTNTSAAIIHALAKLGAGADVVSGGELFRARRAGMPASRIVFAGVGKTIEEIDYALKQGILALTVESEPELERIAERASRLRKKARLAFRVNPDVDPETHHYISTGKKENKFGLDAAQVASACARAAKKPYVEIVGLHMHIGSQILSAKPFATAMAKVKELALHLKKHYPSMRFMDIGGGLGIDYRPDQDPLDLKTFAGSLVPTLKKLGLSVIMEPGRFLVGNAGILVTRVQYIKRGPTRQFVIVDAGMNDLIRPSLYQAHHEIIAVRKTRGEIHGDVVGPICESSDFLGKDRDLPAVTSGDLLAVMSAGAYGFSMSSNYNSRNRAAEVMVSGRKSKLIKRRERKEDLIRGEIISFD